MKEKVGYWKKEVRVWATEEEEEEEEEKKKIQIDTNSTQRKPYQSVAYFSFVGLKSEGKDQKSSELNKKKRDEVEKLKKFTVEMLREPNLGLVVAQHFRGCVEKQKS